MLVGKALRSEISYDRKKEILGSGQLQNRWDRESV